MATALLDDFGIGDARERDEAWRYSKTALRALAQNAFVEADGQANLPAELMRRFAWPETAGFRLVFVNGVHSAAHSDAGSLGPDVVEHGGREDVATHDREVARRDVGGRLLDHVADRDVALGGGRARRVHDAVGADLLRPEALQSDDRPARRLASVDHVPQQR